MKEALALVLALVLAACSTAPRKTIQMTAQDEATVRALMVLSASLADPTTKLAAASTEFGSAASPAWLPESEFRYYRVLVELRVGNRTKAEETLARIPDDSIAAAEAHWIRAKLISERMTDATAGMLRPLIIQEYARVAALRPRSTMAQFVADAATDAREAQEPAGSSPRVVPTVRLGRRFDWQKLVSIAELYQAQRMYAEAAKAYGWSLEVRYPDEWLQSGASATWERIANCHEQRGDRALSLRYLVKALMLPIDDDNRVRLAEILSARIKAAPSIPNAPSPDRTTLVKIATSLVAMEMFDEALTTYERAAALHEDTALAVAETLEQRAGFLLAYRRERSRSTVLFGAPLSWDRVAAAFEEAKKAFGATDELRARSNEALREIEKLAKVNPNPE